MLNLAVVLFMLLTVLMLVEYQTKIIKNYMFDSSIEYGLELSISYLSSSILLMPWGGFRAHKGQGQLWETTLTGHFTSYMSGALGWKQTFLIDFVPY